MMDRVRELVPDIAIVDPTFVLELPPRITADTGIDVLTHAVEGYTCSWHNDFSDGLCLKAIQPKSSCRSGDE